MLQAMVDSDDFKSGNEKKMDAQLLVRFFLKEREDKTQTLKEGRPIFKEVEYCEIRIRGATAAQACRPATYADIQRFPEHYDRFKRRIEEPESGTPLSQWPQINRTQVEEMSFLGVKTVEQLVDLSDTHAAKFRNGYSLKRLAKEFLEYAGKTQAIAENVALKTRIDALEKQVQNGLDRLDNAMSNPNPNAEAEAEAAPDTERKPISRRTRPKPD